MAQRKCKWSLKSVGYVGSTSTDQKPLGRLTFGRRALYKQIIVNQTAPEAIFLVMNDPSMNEL